MVDERANCATTKIEDINCVADKNGAIKDFEANVDKYYLTIQK